jgi:cell cycle sensor histidine kinase DivJ
MLVHPSAQLDVLTCVRHRAFIAPRLIGCCAAFTIVPIYLGLCGTPSGFEIAIFGWLITPMLTAFFLSRTGRYEVAHTLSALALSALIAGLAWHTGGIASFAATWLVLVPLEAALSASRRTVALASIFASSAAGLLVLAAPVQSALSVDSTGVLAALAIISASLYGAGLARGAESLARRGLSLLHAEEDRYRLLARHMTDVIARHDRKGAVLFISPAAEPLFGASLDSLIGHGLFDRVHVGDRPAYLSALAEAAAGETRSLEFRVRGGANGPSNFVWVEMRCRPLENVFQESNEHEVVVVMRDISERKCQEQALDDTRADLERANAGKSRFLATMSHELRTPLNAIIGFSEMMTNDRFALAEDRRFEYARLINESGRHLLSVVNGILDMSKIESGALEILPEPIAPARVVESCCDLLALKAQEACVELKMGPLDRLPDIVADRRALSQILINLVSNAIKFTDRGGRVIVSVARETACLAFSVEDTGIGIGTEDLSRVGEAFFQTRASYDRRHDGTGLGVSIVKGLVRLHGGSTEIRSRLGKGTRVTIRLPLDCDGKRPPMLAVALVPKIIDGPQHPADQQVRKRA